MISNQLNERRVPGAPTVTRLYSNFLHRAAIQARDPVLSIAQRSFPEIVICPSKHFFLVQVSEW